MKMNHLQKTLLTAIAVVFMTSLYAQDNIYLIGGPVNKSWGDWNIGDKIELTKDLDNPSLFYFKGYLACNFHSNEPGAFKFLVANDWGSAFHPNSEENQPLTGVTDMRQDGSDTKWVLPNDSSANGYYELTFDAAAKTLSVDLFRHDVYPEVIYPVGFFNDWNNNTPEAMTRTNPEVAVYTWSGHMKPGEFKILNPLCLGNWDFCYVSTTPMEPVTLGVPQGLVYEINQLTPLTDNHFVVAEEGEYTMTVNLVNMTMTLSPATSLVNGELNTIKVVGVNGKIRVQTETESIKTIDVFAIDGRRVASELFSLNVEIALPKGVYIIKVNDSSSKVISKKIVL